MKPKALKILSHGLSILQGQVQLKKARLEDSLARRETISHADEVWLDTEANLVDEERVIETLRDAADYAMAMEGLDNNQKGVVRRLREAAGDIVVVPGKKHKHMFDQKFSHAFW